MTEAVTALIMEKTIIFFVRVALKSWEDLVRSFYLSFQVAVLPLGKHFAKFLADGVKHNEYYLIFINIIIYIISWSSAYNVHRLIRLFSCFILWLREKFQPLALHTVNEPVIEYLRFFKELCIKIGNLVKEGCDVFAFFPYPLHKLHPCALFVVINWGGRLWLVFQPFDELSSKIGNFFIEWDKLSKIQLFISYKRYIDLIEIEDILLCLSLSVFKVNFLAPEEILERLLSLHFCLRLCLLS